MEPAQGHIEDVREDLESGSCPVPKGVSGFTSITPKQGLVWLHPSLSLECSSHQCP